jgi:antitoxin HigA-1
MSRIPTNRPPTHPGEMLREEFIEALQIPQTKFAQALGISYVRLNEIVNERRGITPDTAVRLGRLLGMSPDFWLSLQANWDLYSVLHSKSAAEFEKIKPLPELAHAS